MSAPRKFDQEFRERAVRLYRERRQQHDDSKLAARRQVGVLLDLNPATLRNWVEDAERADGVRAPARSRVVESEEVRALRRENAELRRANEILRTASAFFAQAELDRRLK
jgi:transposase